MGQPQRLSEGLEREHLGKIPGKEKRKGKKGIIALHVKYMYAYALNDLTLNSRELDAQIQFHKDFLKTVIINARLIVEDST